MLEQLQPTRLLTKHKEIEMNFHINHNWTPKNLAFHLGTFTRAKYIQHSAYMSVSALHHQIDLVLQWTNKNLQAKY